MPGRESFRVLCLRHFKDPFEKSSWVFNMAATAADPHKKPRHPIRMAWQTSRCLNVATSRCMQPKRRHTHNNKYKRVKLGARYGGERQAKDENLLRKLH